MDINIVNWAIAVAPIAMLIILMTAFKWSVQEAAGVTLIVTLISAVKIFGGGGDMIINDTLKGFWNAFQILYVTFPAMLLYELIDMSGSMPVINRIMTRLSPNELFKILTVGWVVVSFFQAAIGLGVPVAICVPVLIGLGVSPVWAVVVAMLGQAWGGCFGTLGVPWVALVDLSGITGDEYLATAIESGILLWALNLMAGLLICWLYSRWEGILVGLPFVLVVSLIHGGLEVLLMMRDLPVSGFIPSTVAFGAVFLLSRTKFYRKHYSCELSKSRIMDEKCVIQYTSMEDEIGEDEAQSSGLVYFAPYILLILAATVLMIITPINTFLNHVGIGFGFSETVTSYGFVEPAVASYSTFHPLTDAGTILFISIFGSHWLFVKKGIMEKGSLRKVFAAGFKKVRPSAVSVCLLLIIAKVLSGSGMMSMVALGITGALGEKYILLTAATGVIGAFVTGSHMSTNILLTDVQVNAAQQLGTGKAALLAAQTGGIGLGSMISPSRIIMGTISGRILGKEGEVIRILLPVVVVMTIAFGLVCSFVF